MAFIFGGGDPGQYRKKDPLREMQSELRSSLRLIHRETLKARHQERALALEIKTLAKSNQIQLCHLKARELVRLRVHLERLQNTSTQLTGMSQNLTSVALTQTMQTSIAQTSKMLKQYNSKTNVHSIMKMMREYALQSEQFEFKQEAVTDAIDDATATENEELATDSMVAGVLQELGVESLLRLSVASSQKPLSAPFSGDTFAQRLAALKPTS